MECSGRGVLLDNGQCECIDGWMSVGDMRMQTGLACDVSKVFVRVVYSFPLLLFPAAIYHSARELLLLKDIKGWRKLCRPTNKVFVIHSCTILASLILTAAYIEKLVHPERSIGIDSAVTWLFFMGMTFFFIVVASAFGLMVTISIKQEKWGGSKAILNLLRFARYLIPFLCFSMGSAFSLVVAAVYVRPVSLEAAENLIMGFWIILSVNAIALLIGTPIVLHSACRDLDAMVRRHSKDGKAEDIAKLSKKLKAVRKQSIFRGIVNSSAFLIMACWSTARYYGPYVIGVQALAFSVIVLTLSTLTNTKSNGTSSSQGSKTAHRFGTKDTLGGSKEDEESKRSTKDDLVVVGFVAAGSAHPSALKSISRPNTGEE